MSKIKVSVIIHFLNSSHYLQDAVKSVLWQTFVDWELVLVDGGSIDESVDIAREFENQFPDKIRVFEHAGPGILGIYSSRIWGAEQAKSAILAHLDSDDEWHPQFLERQYEIFTKFFSFDPGMVFCPMVYWWDDPDRFLDSYVQPVPKPGLHESPELVVELILDGYAKSPGNSAVMISRKILLQAAELIGIAEEGTCDDQYLWSFVALRYPVCVNPEPLCRYRQWSASSCAKTFAEGSRSLLRLRNKHIKWLRDYIKQSYTGRKKQRMLDFLETQFTGSN